MIDLQLFKDMLGFDSTSGSELLVSEFLQRRISAMYPRPETQDWRLEDGSHNLLFSWGRPKVVFCTHMDTVPPYIAPRMEDGVVWGRGACDAKGQIISMLTACQRLAEEGLRGFGLLLLSGEETGSWGAKAFAKLPFQAPYLIVGEPTENKMASACKGTKAFQLHFSGEPFHSGYPQYGMSAVDAFVDYVNALREIRFDEDPLLGPTTWNIGKLSSDNPQNVLSPALDCRLYFRTTFATDAAVAATVRRLAIDRHASVKEIGGDAPAEYFTLPGFESAPLSFGSDAPHLVNFEHRAICGPGSIRFAHRDDEHIRISDIEKAVEQYIAMFKATGV